MAAEDWIDVDAYMGANATCRHCEMSNLYWENTRQGWRLFDGITDRPHRCPVLRPRAKDEFEVEPTNGR